MSNSTVKMALNSIISYGSAVIILIGIIASIIEVSNWLSNGGLSLGADIRYIPTEFIITSPGIVQGLKIINAGTKQAQEIELQITFENGEILDYEPESHNVMSPIVMNLSNNRKTVYIKIEKMSPKSEQEEEFISLLIKGDKYSVKQNINCRHNTGSCKEGYFRRPISDYIIFISWAFLAVFFLLRAVNFIVERYKK